MPQLILFQLQNANWFFVFSKHFFVFEKNKNSGASTVVAKLKLLLLFYTCSMLLLHVRPFSIWLLTLKLVGMHGIRSDCWYFLTLVFSRCRQDEEVEQKRQIILTNLKDKSQDQTVSSLDKFCSPLLKRVFLISLNSANLWSQPMLLLPIRHYALTFERAPVDRQDTIFFEYLNREIASCKYLKPIF